ncbi:hypothetical protein [Rhizobacter sp. Root1221]|uniref:hypothetical protein n=1 Tax=Rhizobacter sp. Root1221 TaxID=1736433 RepID=UPI0012F7975F|nr:hypothetical protein [Rhizobacter sp. Root1221]
MPLIISGAGREAPKRSPIGIYDTGILCLRCEEALGATDSYGIDVLLKRFGQLFLPKSGLGRTVGFEATEIANHRLLQFLIAVLWRASVSSQDFYGGVKLGPHEDAAKQIAFDVAASSFGVFDAILSKWRDDEGIGLVTPPLLNPHRERWHGVNAYRFYFGQVVAYIKVDARSFPEPLRRNSLLNASTARVVSRNIATSKDFGAMVSTTRGSVKAEEARRAGRRGNTA